jgi:hypothetical protein
MEEILLFFLGNPPSLLATGGNSKPLFASSICPYLKKKKENQNFD